MSTGDRVGIVVIGRNEAAQLPACLQSLSLGGMKIVYADSASTDGSSEIAAKMGASIVQIDSSSPLTPARGRNEGFDHLLRLLPDCEFVQFVDGDSVVADGWVEEAISVLSEHQQVAVVCGHVVEAHPDRSVYNWLCGDEWKGDVGRIDACGGNAMIRVVALREAGGFRGDLVAGEEAELMARMRDGGWEIWRLDRMMVTHDANIVDFPEWWRRNWRAGYAAANVWWITRKSRDPVYGPQLRSPMLWVIAWPSAVVIFSLLVNRPAGLLFIPLGWALQIARTAAKRSFFTLDGWRYASMIMLGRIPETLGALSFARKRVVGR